MTDTIEVPTRQLIRASLDWAVAIAHGWNDVQISDYEDSDTPDEPFFRPAKVVGGREICGGGLTFEPSTDYGQGGWMMEWEGIDTRQIKGRPFETLDLRHFDAARGDTIFRPEGWNRDMVRRPRPQHRFHGQWLARYADSTDSSVRWSLDQHYPSPTQLVAAMRCKVGKEMGQQVAVPARLVDRELLAELGRPARHAGRDSEANTAPRG